VSDGGYNRLVPFSRVPLLVVLCGLTFIVGLGRPAITDSDEAFYAEAAREMQERDDWITPHYNGEVRFEKPILYYWLAAGAASLSLDAELAARLPSALAGLVLVLTTFVAARRWYDLPTAGLAGAITGTSFGYIAAGRQALPDLALACFITLAIYTALVVLVCPSGPVVTRQRFGWLGLAGAALAGGFLTKGPVALVLPVLVVGPLALWRVRSARTRGAWWQFITEVGCLAAVWVLLSVPWFAAMTDTHGVAYLDRFFMAENLERFSTARYNNPRPLWYYVPIVVGGLLPWSPLMALWARPALRILGRARRVAAVEGWLLLWAATPLLFYSVSIGKQPRYVLPILPPLAILLARAIARRLPKRAAARPDSTLAAAGVGSGLVIAVLGLLVYRARPLLVGVDPSMVIAGTATLILAGGGVVLAAVVRQRWLPLTLAAASVVATLSIHYVVLSRPGPEPVEEMATLIQSVEGGTLPYGRYRMFVRNLVFYMERPHVDVSSIEQVATFLSASEHVLCVLEESDLVSAGVPAFEIGRVSYLNTGSLTLDTLIWPDPETDLQTVLLVSNRPSILEN
jgi:4-amino-4-deoxy-L-arabinose transferase-like glycosyltransferase